MANADNSVARMLDVFFYGLFMDAAVLQRKGVNPREPRAVTVRGYRVALGEKTMLLREPGATAQGMVFRVTHAEIALLYGDQPEYRPGAAVGATQKRRIHRGADHGAFESAASFAAARAVRLRVFGVDAALGVFDGDALSARHDSAEFGATSQPTTPPPPPI